MRQRVTEEQIDHLEQGGFILFTKEMMLHVLEFMPQGIPLVVEKTEPGLYRAYSMRKRYPSAYQALKDVPPREIAAQRLAEAIAKES